MNSNRTRWGGTPSLLQTTLNLIFCMMVRELGRFISPGKILFPSAIALREIHVWFSMGKKSFYLPHHHAINYLSCHLILVSQYLRSWKRNCLSSIYIVTPTNILIVLHWNSEFYQKIKINIDDNWCNKVTNKLKRVYSG